MILKIFCYLSHGRERTDFCKEMEDVSSLIQMNKATIVVSLFRFEIPTQENAL